MFLCVLFADYFLRLLWGRARRDRWRRRCLSTGQDGGRGLQIVYLLLSSSCNIPSTDNQKNIKTIRCNTEWHSLCSSSINIWKTLRLFRITLLNKVVCWNKLNAIPIIGCQRDFNFLPGISDFILFCILLEEWKQRKNLDHCLLKEQVSLDVSWILLHGYMFTAHSSSPGVHVAVVWRFPSSS